MIARATSRLLAMDDPSSRKIESDLTPWIEGRGHTKEERSPKISINGGVVAGQDLPKGATGSIAIGVKLNIGLDLIRRRGHVDNLQDAIEVVSIHGHLQTADGQNLSRCLEFVSSAGDRHEQNVEVARSATNPASFSLRTLRPIRRGQSLLVWYEEGLAREMGVPILTPANIKGHQEYTCTRCQAVYSQPNVLKAHLHLECNQQETPATHELTLTPFNTLLEKIKVRSRKRDFASAGTPKEEHVMVRHEAPTMASGKEEDDDNALSDVNPEQAPLDMTPQYQCCHRTFSPHPSPSSSLSSSFTSSGDDDGSDDGRVSAKCSGIDTCRILSTATAAEARRRATKGKTKITRMSSTPARTVDELDDVSGSPNVSLSSPFLCEEYDVRSTRSASLVSPSTSPASRHDGRGTSSATLVLEDRFMTPDSSTEQHHQPLTPSKLLLESEHAVALMTDRQNCLVPVPQHLSLSYRPWVQTAAVDSQVHRMGISSGGGGGGGGSVLPLAINCYNPALPMSCYPLHQRNTPVSVHPLHMHYMTYGRLPSMPGGNHLDLHLFNNNNSRFEPANLLPHGIASELAPLLQNRTLMTASTSLQSHPQIPQTIPLPPAPPAPHLPPSSSMQEKELNVIIPPSSPQPPFQASINNNDFLPQPRSSPVENQYAFSLPSDKEPLDFLPQAFLANKSKRGHLCLYCGKLYSRKYGLKIHMRTHNGYKPLKCRICSRPFGDPSNLNKHVRLHAQGETPYRCEYCGKVLVRRRDLERHVRSRHPMNGVPDGAVSPVIQPSPCSSPIISVMDASSDETAQVS